MFQFVVGFASGAVLGVYIAQNYEVPDVSKVFGEAKSKISTLEKKKDD